MVLNYKLKTNKKLKLIKYNILIKNNHRINLMCNELGLSRGTLISGNSLIKEFESYPLDNYIKNIFN